LLRHKSLAVVTRPADAEIDLAVVEREWRRIRSLVEWARDHVAS
jgi:hypothetical protein